VGSGGVFGYPGLAAGRGSRALRPDRPGRKPGRNEYPATQWIPDVPYHRFAELLDLKGIYCEDGDEVGDAWAEALAADRPCVLEVKVDPEVPPLPPHVSPDMVKNMARAMVKGAERAGVMEKSLLAKLAELKASLPGTFTRTR
jgi:pyruvate dehydrogenase (quinone)